ncbi:MAG TPA: SMP-30/gluconolactonase/LRE family protein [Lacipirellulaceae bacterium]|nr:SMP-30/gluconolactonase/LRE family protein [Lacipirellulaceae bacterium]
MHSKYSRPRRLDLFQRCARSALALIAVYVCGAVAESRAGDLLVVDRLSFAVYRYSDQGALLGTVVGPADNLNANLNQPTGIGISPDAKEIFVSSSQNNLVVKYDYNAATGKASNPSVFADASAGLAFPNDIQFSPDGSKIYVANLENGSVAQFNTDGSSAGPPLLLPGGSGGQASSMAFVSPNELLVGAFAGGGVAKSNSDVSAFPGYLVAPTSSIAGATGLMIHDTHVYVSGLFTASIQRFDLTTGQIDSSWGVSGVGFPQDLAVAPDGNGFLAGILGVSSGAGNISRYAFDGTFENTFASPGGGGFTEATAFAAVPTSFIGDFNNDGVVDVEDYVVWRDASPTATLPNDLTPGTVDASDYADWRANFGKSWVASGASLGDNSVPEPSGCLLLLTAVFISSILRNRT